MHSLNAGAGSRAALSRCTLPAQNTFTHALGHHTQVLRRAAPQSEIENKQGNDTCWQNQKGHCNTAAQREKALAHPPQAATRCEYSLTSTHTRHHGLAGLAIAIFTTTAAGPVLAASHAEPANALSIPTWMIHISSVIEWTAAMSLMWQYAEVTGNPKWKGMTWGMMPLFAGALTACTYHFFYNSPDLDFLVAIQAGLTWIGNATLWIAAYRIYKESGPPSAQSEKGGS